VPASKQCDESVRQLSNVLGIYNELVALRRLSTALRRRCVFLENVQSLLRSQNSMLMDMLGAGTRTDELRQPGTATSPKTKRRVSEKQPTQRKDVERNVLCFFYFLARFYRATACNATHGTAMRMLSVRLSVCLSLCDRPLVTLLISQRFITISQLLLRWPRNVPQVEFSQSS